MAQMRLLRVALSSVVACALSACASTPERSGFAGPESGDGGAAEGGGSGGASRDGGSGDPTGTLGGTDGGGAPRPDASVVETTTIYANTDDSLYSMNPTTKSIKLIGKFEGMGGGARDLAVTDCAVSALDEVFANTESVVYRATLPKTAGLAVHLTRVATISLQPSDRMYALAFAPAGVLGPAETLIGGDGNGELWSIDPTNGATKDLGSFGADPSHSGNVLALSGDIVFYTDAKNKPTGIATIRSCKPGATAKCDKTNDYLAGIDMTALAAAFSSGTPAPSLLAGIYGGSSTSTGNGVGYGQLFGLGAWQGSVYAFSRAGSGASARPPELVLIDAASGRGTVVPGSFNFTNGWSGAGVTTKVTVTLPPPPPPPK